MQQLPAIPVANLYYLLAYAWDEFFAGDEVDLESIEFQDIHDLLAWVLSRGIRRLASAGMDKSYLGAVDDVARLRGRVLLADSYRRMTQRSGRMICAFDELSANTIPNQILRATCDRLLRSSEISKKLRPEIRHAQRLLNDITSTSITGQTSTAFSFTLLLRTIAITVFSSWATVFESAVLIWIDRGMRSRPG